MRWVCKLPCSDISQHFCATAALLDSRVQAPCEGEHPDGSGWRVSAGGLQVLKAASGGYQILWVT